MRRRVLGQVVAVLVLASVAIAPGVLAAPIGNNAFQNTWARTDKPVADLQVNRTWMWGPSADTPVVNEPYAESPGGQRQVQYFDKSRMEITDPSGDQSSPWYVTNGLLVVELMTGQMQVGNNTFETRSAAVVNVAGDADDPTGPTYAGLATLRGAAAVADGATITQRVDRSGNVTNDPSLAGQGVTAADHVKVPGIDHQVASVFWTFMNSSGTIWTSGGTSNGPLFQNPFYATGYPLTEAYWASVKVAGTYKDVLMQCFERRCLTYTPGNPAGWQVEAGNVGQHYYAWRYQTASAPTPGNVLYQSSLKDLQASTGSNGDTGSPTANGYQLVVHTGSAYGMQEPGQTFGDAAYSVTLRKVSTGTNALGCLVFRAADATTDKLYQFCLVYFGDSAVGAGAFYGALPVGSSADTQAVATYAVNPAPTGSDWNTLQVVAKGDQLTFSVNGTTLGTATSSSSTSGAIGFSAGNVDTGPVATIEFKDLTVRALQP
ncbi:MAG TPA: family 16 glycoside hydrolase [Thermomicrobiaceae bacterium]|nr:family 16 glycoside hydrolase [Thermomicrobiaceae bacterium]